MQIRLRGSFLNRYVLKGRPAADCAADFFMFCFMVSVFLYFFISLFFLRFKMPLQAAAGMMGYISYASYNRKVSLKAVGYILFAAVSWLLCMLLAPHTVFSAGSFLSSLLYLGIALNMISHRHDPRPYSLLFYMVSVTVLFRIYIMRIPISRIVLNGASYNYISVVVLFYYITASVFRLQEQKKISVLQTAVYMAVVISGYGRAGLLSGVILCLGLLFFYMSDTEKVWLLPLLIVLCAAAVVLLIFWEEISTFLFANTVVLGKFAEKGVSDNGRFIIWQTFLANNCGSMRNLFFGSDPELARFDGNLHNSFLQMYSSFGLVFLTGNIVMIAGAMRRFWRRNRQMFLLFVVLILRAFTDKVFFPGFNEVLYFFFIFLYLTEVRYPRRAVVLNISEKEKLRHVQKTVYHC